MLEQLRSALNTASDDDSIGEAPISDSDECEESEDESLCDDVTEWLIFGPESTIDTSVAEVAEVTDESIASVDGCSFDGLHWEHGTEIHEEPVDKMRETTTKIKEGYSHLFQTPIDATFAILPYSFWELMCHEMNRYATQSIAMKNKKYIMGYKWQPVTVQDMLTFFGILMHYMLFPHTGR